MAGLVQAIRGATTDGRDKPWTSPAMTVKGKPRATGFRVSSGTPYRALWRRGGNFSRRTIRSGAGAAWGLGPASSGAYGNEPKNGRSYRPAAGLDFIDPCIELLQIPR